MNLLEIKDLKVDFLTEEGLFSAVNKISFNLKEGEILALIGESGCGKSITALSILNLLPYRAKISKDSTILFKEKELNQLDENELISIRGKDIAMIFQEPMTSLNPVYTIGNQLDEIFIHHNKYSKKEAMDKSIDILASVKLPEPHKVYHMYPHQLSGGMRQRVVIGMAISCNPSLLLADEPTTALDVTIQAEIMKLFEELKQASRGIIFISHNLMLIKTFSHRIAIMYLGEIVEEGRAEEIFSHPLHPYTKGLLNAIPQIGRNKKLNEIPGTVPSLTKIPQTYCRFYDRCIYRMEICISSHPELIENNNYKVRCYLYE